MTGVPSNVTARLFALLIATDTNVTIATYFHAYRTMICKNYISLCCIVEKYTYVAVVELTLEVRNSRHEDNGQLRLRFWRGRDPLCQGFVLPRVMG